MIAIGCGRLAFDPLDGSGLGGDAADDAAGDGAGAPVPPGPALVLHFDEGTGSSTRSEDGSITGTLSGTVAWTTGVRGSSVRFINTAYVDLPQVPALAVTGAVTVSAWYRLDRTPLDSECVPILIHGSSGMTAADNVLYAVNLIPPAFVLFSERLTQQSNGTGVAAPGGAFDSGVWHHLVMVRGATGTVRFYFDGGAAIAASSVQSVNGGTNGHLRIGADLDLAAGCSPFPGSVDEIYLYARALGATEARMLFDAR